MEGQMQALWQESFSRLKEWYNPRNGTTHLKIFHPSRVAVTTDLWTADNKKRGYMAVTGHFIDDSWMLKSCILR